ncbi:hypothetical protein F4804DRAFT_317064, partial [Jackrogersella minutella]
MFPEALAMVEGGFAAEESSRECAIQEPREENILDWNPQRVSSLLNNLGLETSIDDRLAKFSKNGAGLLTSKPPSPILSTPPSPRTRIDPFAILPKQSSRKPSDASARDISLLSRKQSLAPLSTPVPDSPPASDGEEECPRASFDRSKPVKALASPIQLTPCPSFDYKYQSSMGIPIRIHCVRESWGNRSEDPVVVCTSLEESACAVRPQLMRKSGSTASLSTITRYNPIDINLREPTLVEFYALNDEDVLENLPATPKPDVDIPPTPPPKDPPTTPFGRSRSTRHMPIAPTIAINSSSGEITPPRTPTDSQFLTLAYSPTNASGALGAMWAASIANTYKFDLVYVISLWPKGEGDDSDPSRRSTSMERQRKPQDQDHVASRCAIVANPKFGVTGRILAAYGLKEFGSPFRIHAQFHKKMLGFEGWKEYRDELASTGMISRGWTCSFYNDNLSTVQNGMHDGHVIRGGTANRGIVFAAYTRKTTKSVIPVSSSPKQTAILGKLFYDAQTLVDALVHGT